MSFVNYAYPRFPTSKEIPINWDGFKGGWNTFKREVELDADELAEAKNLLLIGSGVPTKRWGSQDFFMAGATGYGRGLQVVKNSTTSTEEILGLTDWGFLTRQLGASYQIITGASWVSGSNVQMVQLNNNVYISSEDREFVKYDFSSLTAFPTISPPTGVTATNYSGATGARTQAWRITAVSQAGETLGSDEVSVSGLPQNLNETLVQLNWTPVSAASSVLQGYNIYRGLPGDERFLGSTDADVTTFNDAGDDTSLIRTLPTADTTGGPQAKYMIRLKDRLILAGLPGEPTKLLISGRVPNHERFDWAGGGGFVLIEPDDGSAITGLGVLGENLIVTKEHKTWIVTIEFIQIGNYTVIEPTYQLLSASQGCSSHDAIINVENDLGIVNERGMFFVGHQQNYDNTLRTAEISVPIRPFFEALSREDITGCNSAYVRGKWILNFPVSKRSVIFDRERLAFMGPWPTPFGIKKAFSWIDSNNNERMIALDSTDNFVSDFLPTYPDDKGTAIATRLKTKKENYGAWELFKTLRDVYFQFRNVYGDMDIRVFVETKDGQTALSNSFSLNADAARTGWGIDQWGTAQWGLSNEDARAGSDELIRKVIINKTIRTYQVEIETSSRLSNYELLNIKSKSIAQGVGIEPADTWNVY